MRPPENRNAPAGGRGTSKKLQAAKPDSEIPTTSQPRFQDEIARALWRVTVKSASAASSIESAFGVTSTDLVRLRAESLSAFRRAFLGMGGAA